MLQPKVTKSKWESEHRFPWKLSRFSSDAEEDFRQLDRLLPSHKSRSKLCKISRDNASFSSVSQILAFLDAAFILT